MSTCGFNFDTLPTCDSHRYCAVTHLSTFRYSNTENVKNKIPNGLKHSQSNLEHEEHEEHIQKSEKLQIFSILIQKGHSRVTTVSILF